MARVSAKPVKYYAKDEILFLKEMMEKRDTITRVHFLAAYRKGLRRRRVWVDINKVRLWKWIVLLSDAVVMDYANIYKPDLYQARLRGREPSDVPTVLSMLQKYPNNSGNPLYQYYGSNGNAA